MEWFILAATLAACCLVGVTARYVSVSHRRNSQLIRDQLRAPAPAGIDERAITTLEQKAAMRHLHGYFAGDVTATPAPEHGHGAVRLTVVCEGAIQTFWIVQPNGELTSYVAGEDSKLAVAGYQRRRAR